MRFIICEVRQTLETDLLVRWTESIKMLATTGHYRTISRSLSTGGMEKQESFVIDCDFVVVEVTGRVGAGYLRGLLSSLRLKLLDTPN